jgi:hypothetical protein
MVSGKKCSELDPCAAASVHRLPTLANAKQPFLTGEIMLLADRTRTIMSPGTSRIRELANDLKKSDVHIINFAAGESDGDASKIIKNAAKNAIDSGCNKYTPTLGKKLLRQGIARVVFKTM